MEGIERVDRPDHPDRCQGIDKSTKSQCMNLKESGYEYCPLHNVIAKHHETKQQLQIYRFKKFERRLAEIKTANGSRSLDEELALMRMLLEEVVNKCGDSTDLLLYSNRMMELVTKIQGLVLSAQKLASQTGMLVGRAEALVIAGKVVETLSKRITDENLLTLIADDLQEIFLTPVETEEKK
jgi:hypothetical protein